jgi:L-lactate dehydrogenase (cytochrome)
MWVDVKLAVNHGTDVVVVSNHGGRQLDCAPSDVEVLPDIVYAVGSRVEAWMDGGIRSGRDVLKAWAYGTPVTLVGHAMTFGLARRHARGQRHESAANHPE